MSTDGFDNVLSVAGILMSEKERDGVEKTTECGIIGAYIWGFAAVNNLKITRYS